MARPKNPNTDGLIPFNQMSEEKHKELSRLGGIKSGEAKREKRLLKETLLALLEGKDVQTNVCNALILKCLDGDVKAFEVLRDTIGQKPVDKQEVKTINTEWFIGDDEEENEDETGINIYPVKEVTEEKDKE